MKRFSYYYPVFIILTSSIFYNIASKLFPAEINVQAGLAAYYILAGVIAFILFLVTGKGKESFRKEFKKVNWASFTLAFGCLGVDLGYILLFRAGWDISLGSLACNILIAISLIFVGIIVYRERINKQHVIGIALCLMGFALINI